MRAHAQVRLADELASLRIQLGALNELKQAAAISDERQQGRVRAEADLRAAEAERVATRKQLELQRLAAEEAGAVAAAQMEALHAELEALRTQLRHEQSEHEENIHAAIERGVTIGRSRGAEALAQGVATAALRRRPAISASTSPSLATTGLAATGLAHTGLATQSASLAAIAAGLGPSFACQLPVATGSSATLSADEAWERFYAHGTDNFLERAVVSTSRALAW